MTKLFIPRRDLEKQIEKIKDNSNFANRDNLIEFRQAFPKFNDYLEGMYENLGCFFYNEDYLDKNYEGKLLMYDNHCVITCDGELISKLDHYTYEENEKNQDASYVYFGYTGHIKNLEGKKLNLNRIYKMLTEYDNNTQYTNMELRVDTYSEIPFP